MVCKLDLIMVECIGFFLTDVSHMFLMEYHHSPLSSLQNCMLTMSYHYTSYVSLVEGLVLKVAVFSPYITIIVAA